MARTFTLRDEIIVYATIERCFLLSTNLEIVELDLKMRPVRGRTSGLVTENDTIRWEGLWLGLPHFHESLIEQYQPPVFFRDRMITGRFASFEHDHRFMDRGDGIVLLHDEIRFTMHGSWLGDLIGRSLLVLRIRSLMHSRFTRLKRIAESKDWQKYLPRDVTPISQMT